MTLTFLRLQRLVHTFLDHPWAVDGSGSESEQGQRSFLKEIVEQFVSPAPVCALVRGIIQLDGRKRAEVPRLGENEIYMLAGDRPEDAMPG